MTFMQPFADSLEWRALLLLLSLAIWASVVLVAAWLAAVKLRGAAAAARYCVWQFALLGLLIVPLLFAILPGVPLGWQLHAAESRPVAAPVVAPAVAEPGLRQSHAIAEISKGLDVAHSLPSDHGQSQWVASLADVAAPAAAPTAKRAAPVSDAKRVRADGNGPAWAVILLRLWLAGAAIQLVWLAIASVRGWLLVHRARPLVDERFQKSLAELRRQLGLRRSVALLRSERIRVPTVLGPLFPAILLPADCDSWSEERLGMVLAHELAHVERRDVFWQLTARVAAAPYWFHPLVWLAIRRMRQEREQACDDRVLQAGIEATDYAAALMDVAAALRGVRWPMPLAVGMAHRSNLETRVRSILDTSHHRGPAPAKIRRAILLATAALVLVLAILRPFSPIRTHAADSAIKPNVAILTSAPKAPAKSPTLTADGTLILDQRGDQITPGVMHVRVLRPDGKPFPGVKLHAGVWTHNEKFEPNRDYKSDPKGQADIVLPHSLYILRIWADKPGFVSQVIHWENLPRDKRRPVPEHLEIRMQPGTVIGGRVVDEDGKPISGADVSVENFASGTGTFSHWEPAEGDLRTDRDGRWKLDNMPPGDLENVRVTPKHPDFISPDQGADVPFSELRAQTAVVRMKRGIRVSGKLTTSDGKPVAGALAIWGDDPYLEHYPQQEVRSDKNGVYRLPPRPAGQLRLTIVAKGWMPEMRMVNVTKANPPEDFHLKPGKTLRVRLVDSGGRTLKGAYFRIDEWRGAKSLYNYDHPNVLDSKIPRNPKKGFYEWTWAPDDAVTFQVSTGPGFCAPLVSFTANDKEQVYVLQHDLRISGRVTDAVTGRPVDKYTLVPIDDFGNGLLVSERHNAQQQHGGIYALEPQDRTDTAIRVRIEAEGYRVALSPAFRVGDANTVFDFKLQPALPLHGRVLFNGQPVKNAQVFLATKSQSYEGWKQDENGFGNNYYVKTNDRGEFALSAQFERCRLIAVHDDGYAEIDLRPDQQAGDIVLQPWAHVEGRLWQAGKPVPDAWVSVDPIALLRSSDTPYIQDGIGAQTSRDGRFLIDRVPPRKSSVSTQLSPWRDYPVTSEEYVPVDLQPGQHFSVNLGGNGISVTGKVVVTGTAKKIDLNWSLNDLLRMEPGIEPPAGIKKLGFDWGQGWNKAWNDTDEGRSYLATLHHDFVRLGHDGSFLINGVPAGEYQLALRIYKHDDPEACLTEPIAIDTTKFHVTPADVAHGKLDLGKIEVKALSTPQPGNVVPDFEFQSLDGPAKRLSQFRGKYVLLDFWATWCVACVTALPEVHQLQEKFGDRLAVLPIGLDSAQDELRQFVATRKLSGMQGSLGDWSKTNVPAKLGVSSLPTYLLIGPDGKLIINTWSVEQVRDKLSAEMKVPKG
jgi:beta-lactamase regulating signal transducer with metallopeptidase domain/thiol-disulfide isomerase/thioredoxin